MHGNTEGTYVQPDGTATRLSFDCCQMLATAAAKHDVAGCYRWRPLNLNVARTKRVCCKRDFKDGN